MELTDGYALRAPTPADLEAVVDLVVADELDDAGLVVLGGDFVRGEWSKDGFDPGADAWVAVDDAGAIIGYGQATREDPTVVGSWGVVHPGHRGRGIGSSLLDRIEARAEHLLEGHPDGRFRHSVNARDNAVAALLSARGLRPVRHFWHMQIDLDGPFEPGPAPQGVEIAGVDAPEDLVSIHAVLTEAFADDWGDYPGPFDRWVQEETTSPGSDPTLWRTATERGRIVGVVTSTIWEDRGWVEYLAVLPAGRGRGIGAALLRHAFAAFATRGVALVRVSVDAENPTGATALYERVGMRIVKRWDLWERSSAAPAG